MVETNDKNTAESVLSVGKENIPEVAKKPTERAKPYEFRGLCAKDIPLMSNVIKSIGLSEFKSCLNSDVLKDVVGKFTNKAETENAENKDAESENTLTAIGLSLIPSLLDIAEIVLNSLDKCQIALNKLLASTSNLSVTDVENLSLADYFEMVYDFVKKEEFPDFFKVVSKLFK